MPIYPNFYQTLSACPIVELRGYAAACGLKGRLYAYLDFAGPTGTARDGLAEGMLALAIEKKKLISGQPIIEAASGPFAAALTLAGLTAGHPVVLVMPEDAPALRQETLLRLGAHAVWRHRPPPPTAGTTWTGFPTMITRSTTAALPALPLCRASRGRAKAPWTLS